MNTTDAQKASASLKYIEARFEGYDAQKMQGHFDSIKNALLEHDKMRDACKGAREAFETLFRDDSNMVQDIAIKALASLDAVLAEGE